MIIFKNLLKEIITFRYELIEKIKLMLPENTIILLKNCYLADVAFSYPTDCSDCIFVKVHSLERTNNDVLVETLEYLTQDDEWVNNGKVSLSLFSLDEIYIILDNLANKKEII